MSKRRDTTIAVNEKRREILEEAVIEISTKTRKVTKISEVSNYLIDNYTKNAIQKIIKKIEKEEGRKKTNKNNKNKDN